MTYDNISAHIFQLTKKMVFYFTFFFAISMGFFAYYIYESKKERVLNHQIIQLAEINQEAASILFLSQQSSGKKVSDFDISQTAFSVWVQNFANRYEDIVPNSKPEIALLSKLGKEYYDTVANKNQTNLIASYQNFEEQITLIKRLASRYIQNSPAPIIATLAFPVVTGFFVIFLSLILLATHYFKKDIVSKNGSIIDFMWQELNSVEERNDISVSSNSESICHFDEYRQKSAAMAMETKNAYHHINQLKENVSNIVDKLYSIKVSVQKPLQNTDQKENKEKILYIQKLLSRLFNSVDHLNNLAKDSVENGFQAGILALNISIEAARAGDAGRAFISFSDKMKNFAEKSTYIGNELFEELKELDIVIRKAYAVAKNIMETLNENVSNTVSQNTDSGTEQHIKGMALELKNVTDMFDIISNQIAVVHHSATDLELNMGSTPTPVVTAQQIPAFFIKEILLESLERLYRFSYGIDPPIAVKKEEN